MNQLDNYIISFSSPEDQLLKELDRETHLKVVQPRMLSGNIQGKLLEFIVKMIKPMNILEIGTFTGYSALRMAAGLENGGHIDTIEIDDELEDIAKNFFARSAHRNKITHHIGSALEIAPQLNRSYDMVFIDGDKREYVEYYKMLMGDNPYNKPLVHSNSYLLADNILWYGKVIEPIAHNDLFTKAIVEFNEIVRNDTRVENVIIPIRDGINLIRIK